MTEGKPHAGWRRSSTFPAESQLSLAVTDAAFEFFQVPQRILQSSGGVAHVEVGADIILAGGLNQLDQFPGLHVTGVVLDGDLNSSAKCSSAVPHLLRNAFDVGQMLHEPR